MLEKTVLLYDTDSQSLKAMFYGFQPENVCITVLFKHRSQSSEVMRVKTETICITVLFKSVFRSYESKNGNYLHYRVVQT